jgi:ankyrin repeat protein
LFDSILLDNYDKFVENLYNYSSLINLKNDLGESLLHFCCFYGMIDKYYALINFDAKISVTNSKNNLLHYAAFSGNDDFLIVELIKNNLNPIEKNDLGESVLHLCSNERISHYLTLWCNRNNVNIDNLLDNEGNTILHTSYRYGFLHSINYWKNLSPELLTVKNKYGKFWNEIAISNKNFCKG